MKSLQTFDFIGILKNKTNIYLNTLLKYFRWKIFIFPFEQIGKISKSIVYIAHITLDDFWKHLTTEYH